jgi:transcription antitermination factor NusG
MTPTERAKVVVAFDRYTDDTYKVVDHNFDFYVGDRVKINRTSGFSRGSHGTVTHIITDQYEIRYMVKRDGANSPIYFFADELDLIENS